MPNTAFIAQTPESLAPVRYFTPYDAYFYTIDNRPLHDLAQNIESVGSTGSDSGRRAVLLSQLANNEAFNHLANPNPSTGKVTGFDVSLSGATLTIGKGAWYVQDILNPDWPFTIIRQGLAPLGLNHSLTPPDTSLGDTKNYLVQIKFVQLDSTTMSSSELPYLDSSNPLLPCLLINGEAVVSVKEGVTAPYGTQTTPTPDAGNVPLYVFTYSLDSTKLNVVSPVDSPDFVTGSYTCQLVTGNTLHYSASPSTVNPITSLPVSFGKAKFSPYKPISAKVLYSVSSTMGGDAGLSLTHNLISVNDSVPPSFVNSTYTTIDASSATTLLVNRLEGVIPNSAFAGFSGGSSGTWKVLPSLLVSGMARYPVVSGPTPDSNLGDVTVYEVTFYQKSQYQLTDYT